MIAVVSPAKNLDFKSDVNFHGTQPRLMDAASELINAMKKKSVDEVKNLMHISDKLASLNVERYHSFDAEHTDDNARPAALAFNGDVYQGLQAQSFDDAKMNFAQKHLRILSGLYGVLRPLDLIQPYRLEMGTKLAFDDYSTLYDYWESKIAATIDQDLKEQGDDVIVNLASNEYFKAVNQHTKARIIDVEFKDLKNGKYKIISFYAKKARGLMSKFIVDNQITNPDHLKSFDYEGYYFDEENAKEDFIAFKRENKV